MDLVDAQQTRRIVDRLVGYTLSPLLSRKVRGGLSAGRVQSVAVRLVVEREREIIAFTAARVLDDRGAPRHRRRRALRGRGRPDRRRAARRDRRRRRPNGTASPSQRCDRAVTKVATRTQKRSPAPPFTTSTLQQEASRKLGFSPKRTMSVAQRLYEGVETADGQVGLITYMRTDSTAMAGRGDGRGPRGDRRPLRAAVHDAQGPRLQDEVQGRPGGPRVDPPDQLPARSRFAGRLAQGATSCASTGSSGSARSPRRWRPRSSRRRRSSWPTARYELRASATRRPVRRLRPRLHRGPRRRRRGRRGDGPPAGPRRGDRDERRGRHADPALHGAAAAVHRGDADQGARGARDRPARRPTRRPSRRSSIAATSGSRSVACVRSRSPTS